VILSDQHISLTELRIVPEGSFRFKIIVLLTHFIVTQTVIRRPLIISPEPLPYIFHFSTNHCSFFLQKSVILVLIFLPFLLNLIFHTLHHSPDNSVADGLTMSFVILATCLLHEHKHKISAESGSTSQLFIVFGLFIFVAA
jgi:hypothetical protein